MREKFSTNEIYHIYNRGVDKREIFAEDGDKFRFVHNLYELNDKNPALDFRKQTTEVRLPQIKREPRKMLVEILAFCLMPNHYHLFLKQIKDRGVTEFMRKLGTGYTNYFNQKYARSGVLFQGKFKSVRVEKEVHFNYLPLYIHLNPLDLIESGWRQGSMENFEKAINFLESYRWSSFLDYIGKKNFSSVTQRNFLLEIFGGEMKYKKEMIKWLKDMDLNEIKEVILE